MRNYKVTVGERIVDERIEKGMSQTQLAQKINIAQRTLSNYEGDKTSPNNQFWRDLASQGFDIQYILLGVRSSPETLRQIQNLHSNGGLNRQQLIETIQYLAKTMYELSEKLK